MAEPRKVTPQTLRQALGRAVRRGNPLAQMYLYRLEDAPDKQAEAEAIVAELASQIREYTEAVRPVTRLLTQAGALPRRKGDHREGR